VVRQSVAASLRNFLVTNSSPNLDLAPPAAKGGPAHVGLGEGNTPLVKGISMPAAGRGGEVFFKSEHMNPTGSFKDRYAAAEAASMRQEGVTTCLATSSGNTGSALAAYCARAGIRCQVYVNEVTPEAKLRQILAHGAAVFRVKGFGASPECTEEVLRRLRDLADVRRARLAVSAYEFSPAGMDAVGAIASEVVAQLGGVPDRVFVPVGGGGMLTAIWRGFLRLRGESRIARLPRMVAVQPELNDTVVTPLSEGSDVARAVRTTTSISGLAVQFDIDATRALRSVRQSRGRGVLVSDAEILDAQAWLCVREGLFVEPAGAASVAGYLKAVSDNRVGRGERVVCILSGNGLKDPARVRAESRVEDVDVGDLDRSLVEPQ
jgi:threonine synthase